MREAGHVAHVDEKRNAYRVLVGKLKERDHLESLRIDGRLILNEILKKYDDRAWTGLH
jgi:hypothetical protein